MTDLGFRGSSFDGHSAAMTDWSKLMSSIFSQGSEAFSEAKQRVSQAISQKDLDPQNVDWSKVSSNVVSRVSDALTEAKQLVNQAASQRDIDIQNVDQSKLLSNIVSSATDMFDWSKLWDNILSYAFSVLATAGRLVYAFVGVIFNISRTYWTNMWCSILSGILFALIAVNNWSIVHPYVAAGVLILLSAVTNIGVFLTLSQLTGTFAVILCLLPVQLIIWCSGFRSQGVAKGSFASLFQSMYYSGIVPRGSSFAHLQSTGATMWLVPLTLVSLLSYAGVVIVLGREWGWWFQ